MKNSASIRDFSILIALIASWIFFALLSPAFLGARNLSMLTIEFAITSVLALGMLVVILPGNIDLSVGSGLGLLGGVASVLVFYAGWPAPVAMLVSLVMGFLLWSFMGFIVAREKVPAFIITLGGLLVFKGLYWLVIRNSTVPVVPGGGSNLYSMLTTYYVPPLWGYVIAAFLTVALVFSGLSARKKRSAHGFEVEDPERMFLRMFISSQIIFLFVIVMNRFRGIPFPAVILGIVAFVIYLITQHTPFGRYLYAIGGNEEAAVISGVPVEKVVIGSFSIIGVIVAISGFMQAAYAGSSTTTTGNLMELDAIAACVIGGTSLKGGRGTVMGVLFGALLMASLLNGMTLLAVSPEIKFIARGLVLAVAVWMDVKLSGKK